MLAIATGIPVLLPTTVFTNVYMRDETKGYCKMPPKKNTDAKRERNSRKKSTLSNKTEKSEDLGSKKKPSLNGTFKSTYCDNFTTCMR